MEQNIGPIVIQGSQMPKIKKGLLPENWSMVKVSFVVLILVIVAELVWAAWFVLNPNTKEIFSPRTNLATGQPSVAAAKLILNTDNVNPKVGDNLVVNINLTSNGRETQGSDLSIMYDIKALSLANNASSFTKGVVYSEYLGRSVDGLKGNFRISGISGPSQFAKDGLIGSLNFKVLSPGSTTISVDFKPSSSIDSNVIDAKLSKDILSTVENLTINITR